MTSGGDPSSWRGLGPLLQLGMTFVMSTVLGLAGGFWVDRWLARGAAGALRGEGGFALGLTGLGLRSAGAFGALALTLAGGWAHPLAVIAGLSVLPPVLIAAGVRSAG